MMAAQTPNHDDGPRLDELSGELRTAVQRILGEAPPEDLMRRTLDGLQRRSPAPARNPAQHVALLVILATAASVAVLVLVGPSGDGGGRPQIAGGGLSPQVSQEQRLLTTRQLPTVWAYHQAIRNSPEALDELLDEHAARLLASDSVVLSVKGARGGGGML